MTTTENSQSTSCCLPATEDPLRITVFVSNSAEREKYVGMQSFANE